MLCSGNDAANDIAEHISGSVEKFAELMRNLKNDSSVSVEIKNSIDDFDWEY